MKDVVGGGRTDMSREGTHAPVSGGVISPEDFCRSHRAEVEEDGAPPVPCAEEAVLEGEGFTGAVVELDGGLSREGPGLGVQEAEMGHVGPASWEAC